MINNLKSHPIYAFWKRHENTEFIFQLCAITNRWNRSAPIGCTGAEKGNPHKVGRGQSGFDFITSSFEYIECVGIK